MLPRLLLIFLLVPFQARADETAALPSWRNEALRRSLVEYVERVSTPSSPAYVPPEQRIAVFDNDGTLMAERPLYFQLSFMIAEAKKLAPSGMEKILYWRTLSTLNHDPGSLTERDQQLLERNLSALLAGTREGALRAAAQSWLHQVQHPRFHAPYASLVYAPMLELLELMRSRGFTIYVCSGSDATFLRAFSQELYGIPPEHVIGSAVELQFDPSNAADPFVRGDSIISLNLRQTKALNIHRVTGAAPVFAAGNSNGDIEMLELARLAGPRSKALLVRHDDQEREYAYDDGAEDSQAKATREGWQLVSMKDDWQEIFPAPQETSPSKR